MKMFHSLSEAAGAFKRQSREVLAILSLNGQAYFVFFSNPSANAATIIAARAKIVLGNELCHNESDFFSDTERVKKLYSLMLDAKVPELFPEHSQHAEENLIRNFLLAISLFKTAYPNQKISKIDIFLTQSPCSDVGGKKFSAQCEIHGFFLPAGCDKKLTLFFMKNNYKQYDKNLFKPGAKVAVHYNHKFDQSCYENNTFIKEADPTVKELLSN